MSFDKEFDVVIESLDHEGRGVARHEGKVVFVEGALPGETAAVRMIRSKPSYAVAVAEIIHRESSQRVVPRCPNFGTCGGCSMQHLAASAQVAAKQRVLEDCLERIGGVEPEQIYPAIHGPAWHYRHRARLSVRNVVKKGGVLVGFHERRSSYVADMTECSVLPARISDLLPDMRKLVDGLSVRDRLPQIEVAIGDSADVFVLRILEPLSRQDEARIRAFAERHRVAIALQPKGPASVVPFHPVPWPDLSYGLPDFGITYRFSPTEFTQVNAAMNRTLVSRAMALLQPRSGERIADFFCGLGNFSLPIAKLGAEVVGLEGSQELVSRARDNAAFNGLADRAHFAVADLFRATPDSVSALGRLDAALLDPPRDGAMELIKSFPDSPPGRLVYVSCSPSTLARDAAVLVNVHGYRMRGAGIANMFPHTAHVESIALFERG